MENEPGRVELLLPPDSRYMRLARLMASGVASTCGLPLDEVEDFRIAVDELCAALIEVGAGDRVSLAFAFTDDALVVEGRTTAKPGGGIDEDRLNLSRQILDVVTDGHELTVGGEYATFIARKLVPGGDTG
jgi:anti-sigma regulatory factor (Ser/Thr protein kinase)